MVAAKMLAPTRYLVLPSCMACRTRNGVPVMAAINPAPWLMLFASASPRDCSRSGDVRGRLVKLVLRSGMTMTSSVCLHSLPRHGVWQSALCPYNARMNSATAPFDPAGDSDIVYMHE